MELQTALILGLVAIAVVGLVAWVLRELETALGWLAQAGPAAPTALHPQDVVQAHRELHSR